MKFIFAILMILLLSCNDNHKHREYTVYLHRGKGWNSASTTINCDSVKMFNSTHARVYVDGVATDIFADDIMVSNY